MLLTVAVFFVILSILVLIHELGHFMAAKKLGIKVEEFGFGLPPRIFGKKFGETVYSINWLPIGGFVKLFGEDYDGQHDADKHKKKNPDLSRAFYSRPIWQRVTVLTAGVVMNFMLGVTVISFLFTQGVMVPTDRVHIESTVENSPARQAGLEKGDIIRSIIVTDGQGTQNEIEIRKADDISRITRENLGREIIIVIMRMNSQKGITVVPRTDFPKNEGPLGVVISNYEEKKYPFYSAPFYGTLEAIVLTKELVKGIGITLWKFITFQPVSKDVAGPLGIAQLTGQAVKFGRMAVLELLGILSLNLAIVNILPFPALDGGRLLFVLVEAVTGKKVKSTWEKYIHQAGMLILILLILLITFNDIVKFIGK